MSENTKMSCSFRKEHVEFLAHAVGQNRVPSLQNRYDIEGISVNSKLKYIQNWKSLAQQANWSATKLAKICGASVRTLHRYFVQRMGQSTKVWLANQRQCNAHELLHDGSSVKEVASCLGYKQPTNFTRKYKNHWGSCPSLQSSVNSVKTKNVRK
jgi:transcriptional regulator GlxA family with amidase domain